MVATRSLQGGWQGRGSLLCPQENVLNSFWEPALNGSRFRTAGLPPGNPHPTGASSTRTPIYSSGGARGPLNRTIHEHVHKSTNRIHQTKDATWRSCVLSKSICGPKGSRGPPPATQKKTPAQTNGPRFLPHQRREPLPTGPHLLGGAGAWQTRAQPPALSGSHSQARRCPHPADLTPPGAVLVKHVCKAGGTLCLTVSAMSHRDLPQWDRREFRILTQQFSQNGPGSPGEGPRELLRGFPRSEVFLS